MTKRTLKFAALAALLWAAAKLSPTAAVAATALPLPNPSFENGLEGWTAERSPKMFATAESAASLGKAGLHINDDSTESGRLVSPALPVQENHIYGLEFWGRLVSPKPGTNISMEYYAADGKALKGTPVAHFYGGGSVKYNFAFDHYFCRTGAPTGAATLRVAIETWGSASSITDLDDLHVYDITDGVEPKIDLDALIAIARAAPKPIPKVVIKVDDLKQVNDRIYPRWQKLTAFVEQRKIKAGIGIVFESLEQDAPKYVAWIQGLAKTGRFEFWNHGYDHKEWIEGGKTLQEFHGPGYDQQKQHLSRANQLAREKLGLTMRSFGAPFNSIDETTLKVLAEDPDIQVVMFADRVPGKVALPRVFAVNIENPTFVANYPKFVEGYVHNMTFPVFVIQGHPNSWDDNRFNNFVQIVDFLQSIGAEFTLPSDYAPQK